MKQELEAIKSVVEAFQLKRQEFATQKDQAHVNFQQLTGAIYAMDAMITKYVERVKELEQSSVGDNQNG